MSKNDRHQRRRRGPNWGWLFKLIASLGQATYYVVRIWFWFTDRE